MEWMRQAVFEAVDGVAETLNVHEEDRYSNVMDVFLARYSTPVNDVLQIHGWDVGYGGFAARRTGNQCNERSHRWKVRGYLGVNDAGQSELAMTTLAVSVCDAMDSGLASYEADPAQLTRFEPRLFGSVLCRYVEIDVVITEM